MNEEALNDAYKHFVDTGYDGTIEDYKVLIGSNPEALQDSFKFFTDTGYNGTIEDFSTLLGVKKKRLSRLTWYFSRKRCGVSYRNNRGRTYFFGFISK